MENWQPISTIPTDGKPFLFCAVDAGDAVFIGKYAPFGHGDRAMYYCSYVDTRKMNTERLGGMIRCALQPICWMPFPKPPEEHNTFDAIKSSSDTELFDAAKNAADTMAFSRVFVTSRQRIKKPEGVGMYDEDLARLQKAVGRHNPD